MKQEKTNKQNNIPLKQDKIIDNIRKSQLNATNEYDYNKLIRKQEGLIPCVLEESKENLVISYDIHNLNVCSRLDRERRDMVIATLIDVGKLSDTAKLYDFSLEPNNLYYDLHGRIYVKFRDIYNKDNKYSHDKFIKQYKSLIGCTLVKKYRYEDYNEGGQDLLKEDKLLKEIADCTELEQITDILYEEYMRYKNERRENYIEINKKKNTQFKVVFSIVSILLLMGIGMLCYLFYWERPYNIAVIKANEAYLQSDYRGTIEAMESVKMERMNIKQKYILAIACVKCESFSKENMDNILDTITLNGDEKIMEYWIYINRLDTDAAADIAMQQSNNQLLYYAYLKEKAIVEKDTSMSGQEKTSKLNEINSKLKPLQEEYDKLQEEYEQTIEE